MDLQKCQARLGFVKQHIFGNLFLSFSRLEKAIETAKSCVSANQSASKEILNRLHSYEEILYKQKQLANALCTHTAHRDWNEVSRHIKIINGLSRMIRDDAREIVGGTVVGDAALDRLIV